MDRRVRQACSIEGCEKPVYCRRLCDPHYRRLRRTGGVSADVAIGQQPPLSECAVDGCRRAATERGHCHAHYLRSIRTGTARPERPIRRQVNDLCVVDGCSRDATAKGLCGSHRARKRKYGDVQAHIPIRPMTGTGYVSHGYLVVPVRPEERHLVGGDSSALEHRLVMARELRRPLTQLESVHHRNGDRLDNRPQNLELWSRWQPSGQRVTDKIRYATDVLARYAPHLLADPQQSPGLAATGGDDHTEDP